MILGLRVQKSKRDQKLYAQAALEDATGKIELICFSRDYERLSGAVEDGSAGAGARGADGR
jgi:DNA polymerase-3 subunit alpha